MATMIPVFVNQELSDQLSYQVSYILGKITTM